MTTLRLPGIVILAMALSGGAFATPYDPDHDAEKGHQDKLAYRFVLASPDDPAIAAAIRRDLRFADEMMEHHRGAVRMSQFYLQDPQGQNPFLQGMARAIIHNQRFEIGWLQDLRRRVAAGPQTSISIGDYRRVSVQAGIAGMEHRVRFMKAPVLSASDLAEEPDASISEFDVMFAKSMIMHHQMALDMARAYNADPHGGNVVIEEINFDILRDQAIEIAMLEDFVSNYPGDPDAVPIDPRMHEMMGMPHHGS